MSNTSNTVVGYETPQFIPQLVRSLPEIRTIKLFQPPSSQPIQQDSLISIQEQSLISQALEIRNTLTLPFWDALLLLISTQPINARNVLKRATLHNSQDSDCFLIHRDNCTEARLRERIAAIPGGRVLAMSSKVSTERGETQHVPMLDFHCEASSENDDLVRTVVTELGLTGFVARSGRSYHFYGRNLVDEQALITFLGKSLLFCPIIDRAWIAHQILERACGLRISPGKNYQRPPEIIFEI